MKFRFLYVFLHTWKKDGVTHEAVTVQLIYLLKYNY